MRTVKHNKFGKQQEEGKENARGKIMLLTCCIKEQNNDYKIGSFQAFEEATAHNARELSFYVKGMEIRAYF